MSYGDTGILTGNLLKNQLKSYLGKYRGIVTNTDDPEKRGRIKAMVPKVLGKYDSNWALPAFTPGTFIIPREGAGVWIEFEEGDPNKPVWTGVWFGEGETLENIVDVGVFYKKHATGDFTAKIFTSNKDRGINIEIDSNKDIIIKTNLMDVDASTVNFSLNSLSVIGKSIFFKADDDEGNWTTVSISPGGVTVAKYADYTFVNDTSLP